MKRFLKLFAMLLLVLGIFLFAGCSNQVKPISFKQTETFQTLNEVKYPKSSVSPKEISTETVTALKNFTINTALELFKQENKNYIYSPLSLYIALSMLLEGVSKEEAKLELENLLGLERETNRLSMKTVYENNYYKNNKGILRLANSIWFKNNYPVEKDFLDILAKDYYAESYQTDFDSEGHQNIIDWINYYTEDFLELTKDKFPVSASTVILLLNTIYFDNKWKESFDKKATREGEFYASSGNVTAEFMIHNITSKYKEYDNYQVAEDYFENNASITYILPKAEIDVSDLLNAEVIANALNPADKSTLKLDIVVPKFKYFSKFILNDNLKNLGVQEVFDSSSNSLDLMSKGRGLFVSLVQQNAGIELSESGVKAAAVTGIAVEESASIEQQFILNRPFIYIIKDAYGIPLFMGLLQNPKTE
ncbi:MAG TPA: serpin family protein [Acholeplasmataceae bacterium]|nr:serpin family protein [Acholeplasmataceae bacterium]